MHDIFYFTDVHGCYDLYRAAMDYCLAQDPECTIIYGGDACDRGPDGYKIMKELWNNPQVIYLQGNHEDMFVRAACFIMRDYNGKYDLPDIKEYLDACYMMDYAAPDIVNCIYNGGKQTLIDWMLDGMPLDFINDINDLPVVFSYENLDFCHAGGTYKVFKRVMEQQESDDMLIDMKDFAEMVWDRVKIGVGWAPDRTCIFGHTPTPHLAAKYYGQDKSLANAHPCAYTGLLDDKWTGRKIDMDTGAFASGRLYVLNCLTMQAQGFRDADLENDEIHKHDIEKIEVIQF